MRVALVRRAIALLAATTVLPIVGPTFAQAPKGEIKGSALVHTADSAKGVISGASVALPSKATGGTAYFGKWQDMPAATSSARVPVVVFLHGSSGLGLAAIGEWQRWLAEQGIASVAPDSFALPDRLTYSSPIDRKTYESIHALRASEIDLALASVRAAAWADTAKLVLAGTSEGAVAVARRSEGFAARMIFSWSCEDNYFVEAHATAVDPEQPVLNMISTVDPFFSPSNAWLGNPAARGNCGQAFAAARRGAIVLVPGAPHTLIGMPYARAMVRAFLDTAIPR